MRQDGKHGIEATLSGVLKTDESLHVRLELARRRPELSIMISAGPDAVLGEFAFPPALPITSANGAWVVPEQEGVVYRVHNDKFPPRSFSSMISMPWIGAADLASGRGYMIILETACDARFAKKTIVHIDEKLPVAELRWLPEKGKFGYERRARFAFFDSGGYVAMAKRYRAYAKETGTFRSLEDKARQNADVNKLAGAVDIWCRSSNVDQFGRMLLSLGIDRALLHVSSVGSRPDKDMLARVKAMGFLVGHYDIYTDLHESGHHWDDSARYRQYTFPEPVIRKSDGSPQRGWYTVYDKGKPFRSYVVCATEGLRAMRERVPADLAACGHNTWFIDCTTSCGLYECSATGGSRISGRFSTARCPCGTCSATTSACSSATRSCSKRAMHVSRRCPGKCSARRCSRTSSSARTANFNAPSGSKV